MRIAPRKSKSPRLYLSVQERRALRAARIQLSNLAALRPQALAEATRLDLERCRELVSLSEFQSLDSVGPASAEDLWQLGYRSLADLAGADPADMLRRMQELTGSRQDPCVEDVFRCAVAQVQFPDLTVAQRQWWAWSDQRGLREVRRPAR